jgi:hypothetical protein
LRLLGHRRELAAIVADIGDLSVVRLKAILDHEDARLPLRTDGTGKTIGGGLISRGHFYKILSNPIYLGRLTHKGQAHEGLHDPIVDQETWDRVQLLLAEHAQRTAGNCQNSSPFGDGLNIAPKPDGQSLIRLRALLNLASKRGVGARAGMKLAGHDPLFLRLRINRALTNSQTHGGVGANSRVVPAVLASAHEESVPIFQQLAGGHPSGRDDVRQISVIASKGRRSSRGELKVVETASCRLDPVAPPCGMAGVDVERT